MFTLVHLATRGMRAASCACAASTKRLAVLAVAAAALGSASVAHANGNETCYDFGNQTAGTTWPVAPQTEVPIGIGTIRVHPLKLDGVAQTANVARFEVASSKIAGGAPPELAGIGVAIQMVPNEAVNRIRLRYSHQPGAGDERAATVEVNGVRRDWRGSFERLNGEHIGKAGHPARFTVTPEPAASAGNWNSGTFVVESKDGIRSFTLGAGFMRIDDVCFMR